MKKWRTRIFLPHKNGYIESIYITFLRGIFQGDTFSPLIFCLALALIRNILKRDNVGYKIMNTKVRIFCISMISRYIPSMMSKWRDVVR